MLTAIRSLLGALIVVVTAGVAGAQPYPNKPVHILVPYAAGGAVDVLARTIGQALSKT
jgi:tripartite-type tricarboxylate transporter receptor subunit TctC